jgi:ComF family protein
VNRCAAFAHTWLPMSCALCGAGGTRERVCGACDALLPRLPQERCSVCALPLASGVSCGPCLADPPAYDGTVAVYAYAFPVDAMIAAYKYRGDLSLAPALATRLARAVKPTVDVIVPMPLSAARLRHRGFNQAQELARLVGRARSIPVHAGACRRVVDTVPQVTLPWKERARNVRRAFVCDIDLAHLRVAIVDDVMTTGATLHELAVSLKRAGAAAVEAWVVARTLKD